MGDKDNRILVYAPTGRDAELTAKILDRVAIPHALCDGVDALCHYVTEGAGAIITTAEALDGQAVARLMEALNQQEAWSEIPLLVFIPSGDLRDRAYQKLTARAHLTLLDRPIHIATLISVVKSALRSRSRQYEIRDLMKRLEARVHERDRFLAILGHELRNPLGAILLASQMIEPETDLLEGEHARLIERQSRHLTRLVNDLLDLSRVVSGKIIIQPQQIDLREVARQAMSTLEDQARGQEITLHLETGDSPALIEGDPVRIDQIITNLVSNSIKYTPEGGHVRVTVTTDGSSAIMSVRDDGVGIDPRRIGTIFELFAQAEHAIGRSQGGMGIGLALVRNLVDLHGGKVTARSDGIGRGSEFRVEIPLAMARAGDDRSTSESLHSGHTRPRRIVIIEDNEDLRDLLRLKLHRLGHHVDAVSDGHSGIEILIGTRPDLALIDIGLPGADGYEVARTVRDAVGNDIILIAVSGFGQPEDKRKALAAGFDDHLTKPADVTDIERTLARFSGRFVRTHAS